MSVTRYAKAIPGALPIVARFTATADNDVILPAGNYVVLAAFFHGANVTALNKAGGTDEAGYPFNTANQTVCVTASGTGDVTIVYVEVPAAGLTTFTV
jgi:hypothetical protein